jgi:hypothetical protein
VISVASESEYLAAIGRVSAGTASQRDYELCQNAARGAGPLGDKARAALAGRSLSATPLVALCRAPDGGAPRFRIRCASPRARTASAVNLDVVDFRIPTLTHNSTRKSTHRPPPPGGAP